MRINSPAESGTSKFTRSLSLFDAVTLVVSGIVGASIFIVPADVLRGVGNPLLALLLWVVAGAVTLIVGLVCAELGGMFPEAGGQYVYIREAFGGFSAFLFGWVFFTVANSAGLAAIVIVFALFLGRAIPALSAEHVLYAKELFGIHFEFTRGSLVAIVCIVVLTAVNVRSVKLAARLQNLTASVYLGVVAIIAAVGFALGRGSWSHFLPQPGTHASSVSLHGIGLALIALIFTYDGWEFVTWAAGEIENARRNLPLALIIGILLTVATYLLVNVLFMYALTPERMVQQTTVAEAAMTAMFSSTAGRWVSLFIAMVNFGAGSVVVLGGARIYYCMARDGVFFRSMGRLHPRWNTPTVSLLAQCAWVVVLIASGGYEELYARFAFMITLTYVATVGAVFVLRRTQPNRPRPYRCPWFPWLPTAYLLVALGLALSTLLSRPGQSLTGLGLALLGIPLYLGFGRRSRLEKDAELATAALTPSAAVPGTGHPADRG
jgi:APA family basic amino acid/polyamine antiporter